MRILSKEGTDMVKLRCQLCRYTFDSKTDEMWVCPKCEETGIFDVLSISEKEIHELYDALDYVEGIRGPIRIEPPSIISESRGVYVSRTDEESIIDALCILPLLFERVFVRNMHYLPSTKIESPIIAGLTESKIVVPITTGIYRTLYPCKTVQPILFSEIMSFSAMANLVTSLSYEDMRAMDDAILFKIKKKLRRFYSNGVDIDFYGCLNNELEKYNLDLLVTAKTGFPLVIEPLVNEIHYWKLERVKELCRSEISRELDIVKRFLRSLDISIPINLTFDEITSFREEKASTEFRDALFSLSRRFQEDSKTDAAHDLRAEFYRRKMEFNELANSYAETRMLLLTGIVSTVGGLLGGPVGAIVGGLGTSLISPITKTIFRRMFEDSRKDWVSFFWKWHKASTSAH